MSGVRAALFGATGFLGRYVCSEMGKIGTRVRAGNRGCEMESRHLKVNFDHGQFHAPFYSVRPSPVVVAPPRASRARRGVRSPGGGARAIAAVPRALARPTAPRT